MPCKCPVTSYSMARSLGLVSRRYHSRRLVVIRDLCTAPPRHGFGPPWNTQYLHFHYLFVLAFLLVVLCSYRSVRIYRVPTSMPRLSRLGQWVKTLGFCITIGYIYMIEDSLMLLSVQVLFWALIAWYEHNQHGFIPID